MNAPTGKRSSKAASHQPMPRWMAWVILALLLFGFLILAGLPRSRERATSRSTAGSTTAEPARLPQPSLPTGDSSPPSSHDEGLNRQIPPGHILVE